MESYEKKYKELESKIKKGYLYAQTDSTKAVLEEIMPELKDSEDERIRKEIIEYIKTGTYHKDWIAWLENQGGQKTNIPKWKYKKDDMPLLKDSIILNKYGCVVKSPSGAMVSDAWVLDYDELTKLPKEEKVDNANKVKPKFHEVDFDLMHIKYGKEVFPATKEQCDKLFKAMADAGYTFDFDKKELKKIEFNPDDLIEESYQQQADDLIDMVTEKPTWSEDDEQILLGIIDELEANKSEAPEYDYKTYDKFIDWLESLKDRVQPHPRREWSKEDKVMLDEIIDFFENGTVKLQHDLSLYASWLKSLRPQPQWKPSDEQMDALCHVISGCSYDIEPLVELEKELKKMKGGEE